MPATLTAILTDGRAIEVPEGVKVLGVTSDGYVVAEADGLAYGLTPCCGASATGSFVDDEPAIVCRSCYDEVDPLLGGEVTVAVPVATLI